MSLQSSSFSSFRPEEENDEDGISSCLLDAQYTSTSTPGISNWMHLILQQELDLKLEAKITEVKGMCLIAIDECRQVSHQRSIDPRTMELLESCMGYLSDPHSDKSTTTLNNIKTLISCIASSVPRGQSFLNLLPIEEVVQPHLLLPPDHEWKYILWLKSQFLASTLQHCYMTNLVDESISFPTRSDTSLDSRNIVTKSESEQCMLLQPVTTGHKLLERQLLPLIWSWEMNEAEAPFRRLVHMVQRVSSKALNNSVNDIWSVVHLSDCVAGAAPVPGARGSISNPFIFPTDAFSSLSPYLEQTDSSSTKKMKRSIDAVSPNSVTLSDADKSTARIKTNQALEEEIREINQRSLDTVVTVIPDGSNLGTMLECSFNTVTISPKILRQPIEPLRLLVPANYPECSPSVFLETRPEDDEFSMEGKSRLEVCLGSLVQPLSLKDIAESWGACVREVIDEYAMQNGGGSFSLRHGTWETV